MDENTTEINDDLQQKASEISHRKQNPRSRGKRKKRLPVYFLFFIGVLTVMLIVLIAYGWDQIDKALVDYENTLPVQCVKEYYKDLSDGDFSRAINLSGFTENEFTTIEDVENYFNRLYKKGFEELEYIKKSVDEKQGTIEYYIYSDSKKIGHTLIKKTGAKSKYGFDLYTVAESDPIQYYQPVKIIVPEKTIVTVNGTELDGGYKTDTISENFDFSDTGYKNFKQPCRIVYEIKDKLLAEPEIKVFTPNGSECIETEPNKETGKKSFSFTLPDENKEKLSDTAKKAATEYSKAIEHGTSMDGFFEYVIPDSKLYNKLKNYHSSWIIKQPEYSGESIDNFQISNYKEYSDSFVMLDISLDYTIYTYKNTQKNVLKASYRMYFTNTKNGWKIFNMDIS